jgi:lysozyme
LDVHEGREITKDEALGLLAEDLHTAASRLGANVRRDVILDLTENQYAALLSFVHNLGANPKWTIWKRLNARQFDQVPLEMMKFVNAGGKKVQGLVNRRADEVKLWSLGEPGSTAEPVPSSVTRSSPTPPTVADPKPLAKQGTIWAGAGVAVGGAMEGARNVQGIIAPQAAHSEWLMKVMGFVSILIVIGGVLVMVFKYLDHKKAAH